MAWMKYRIDAFYGINQSETENNLPSGESPDACNMDTFGGRLSVARGYVRESQLACPAESGPLRLFCKNTEAGPEFVIAGRTGLSVLSPGSSAWRSLGDFQAPRSAPGQIDFLLTKVEGRERLLTGSGAGPILSWDLSENGAAAFGSAEQLSDAPVTYLELYFGRLFAAGDAQNPCRLYFSCAPGDGRSIADWSSQAGSENVSGGYVEVGADSDPITGLFALSNQLVIFKKDSLYRLLGDRPGNYRICPINASMADCIHSACVRNGDVLYFLTSAGLYCFDGQEARRMPDADKVKTFLAGADLSNCTCAACGDKLYFCLREGGGDVNNAMLIYDLYRGVYMLRRGFTVRDVCALGRELYLFDGGGYVCRFDVGDSYAGEPIQAYWTTPETDLNDKSSVKKLRELYIRGAGGVLSVSAETAGGTAFFARLMPPNTGDVLEAPIAGEGRAFRLRLANELGSRFCIEGGLELTLDAQRRPL